MIATGTGVAPFIGFCQEKEYLLSKGIDKCPGEFTLYFGCRHQIGDFIYKNDITKFVHNNILNQSNFAFSRDQSNKLYVQDLVEKNSQ